MSQASLRWCALAACCALYAADAPADARLAVGADAGAAPQVTVFDVNGSPLQSFFAFAPIFTGGVRVALADIDGDGVSDVIAGAGAGGAPQVRVFSGSNGSVLRDFLAFPAGFVGGIYVAGGDVNGDGRADIIVGAGSGGTPQVRAFSGRDSSLLRDFLAFEAGFTGGVRVAAGDIDGDARADIGAARGPGGTPQVRVFSGRDASVLHGFLAYAPGFTGGVFVASGDVDGDGRADLVTGADAGGGPQVNVFSGEDLRPMAGFFAYAPGFTGGVRVAAADLNGDRVAELLSGPGAGIAPQVNVYPGPGYANPASFLAFAPTFTGGLNVAAPSIAIAIFRGDFE